MEHLRVSLKVKDSRRLMTECVICEKIFELDTVQVWVHYHDPTGDCVFFLGYMCGECFESEHEQLREKTEHHAKALEERARELRSPIVWPNTEEQIQAQKELKELEDYRSL